MESLNTLFSQKIFSLTEKIQESFPGIYEHLDETPFSLKFYSKDEIDDVDLMNYLEELIFQMNYYKKTTDDYKRIHLKNLIDNTSTSAVILNENWNYKKEKLLAMYPILSETDLLYIDGKKEEMLERVCTILAITKEEVNQILRRI